MKRLFFIFFALTIMGLIASCGGKNEGLDNKNNDSGRDSIASAKSNFLWKIESGDSKVYILGHLNIGARELIPLDSIVEKRYRESDVLVLEVKNNEEFVSLMKKFYTFEDGSKLEDHVSPELFSLIVKILNEKILDIKFFTYHTPWAVVSQLQLRELMLKGYKNFYSFDDYLKRLAPDKPIDSVFQPAVETNFLSRLIEASTEEDWIYYLKNLNSYYDKTQKKVKAYKDGDIKLLTELIDKDAKSRPNITPAVYKNNEKAKEIVLNRINELLKSGKTSFILLGIDGMLGERGTIHYLKEQGLNVSEVK